MKTHLWILLCLMSWALGPTRWSVGAAPPANPVVTDDSIYLVAGGLLRMDRATGARSWHVLADAGLREPALADDVILVSGQRTLYALDRETGAAIWRHELEGQAFAPVVSEDRVLVTTDTGGIWAFSTPDGRLLWRSETDNGWLYPPAILKDLVVTGGQGGYVVAYEKGTGDRRWQVIVDQELVYSPVSVDGEHVAVTTFAGDVILLHAKSGREQWRTRFPSPSFSPAVWDEYLYLASMGGWLRALDANTGALRWERPLPARNILPLVMREGVLLVMSEDDGYQFLEGRQGALLAAGRLSGSPLAAAWLTPDSAAAFVFGGKNLRVQTVVIRVE